MWSEFSEVLPGEYNLRGVPFFEQSCVTMNIHSLIQKQGKYPTSTIPRQPLGTTGACISESVFSILLPETESFLGNWLLSVDSLWEKFRIVKHENI